LVVIKLEVYFLIAFVVIYGLVDVHYEIPEFPLTIAIIPLLWVQVAMTIISTKRESKLGAVMAIVRPSDPHIRHRSYTDVAAGPPNG
jgi:hypothetical protein